MNSLIKCLLLTLAVSSFSMSQESFRDSLRDVLDQQEDKVSFLKTTLKNTDLSKLNKAIVSNFIGLQYQYSSELDSAECYHRKALKLARLHNSNNEEIGIALNKIGIIHYYSGVLDSAAHYFEQSIPYYQDAKLKANSLNNLAMMNKKMSLPDRAIENYIQSADLFKQAKMYDKQSDVLSNIGALFSSIDNLEDAEFYFDKALKLAEENKYEDGINTTKSNLGNVYKNKGEYARAIACFEEANKYYVANNLLNRQIESFNNQAIVYGLMKRPTEEKELYLKVIDIIEKNDLRQNETAALSNLGSFYHENGDSESALIQFNKAHKLIVQNEQHEYKQIIYKNLSEAHQALGQLDSSLYYSNLNIAYTDSINKIEKDKKMLELEAEYRNNELNEDLKGEQEEKKKVGSYLLTSLLVVGVILIVLAIIIIQYRKRRKEAEKLQVENENQDKSISELNTTLSSKEVLIKDLEHKSQTGKLPYPKDFDKLTERESDVLAELSKGLKDQEIADNLFISITTVRTHLRKAYVKIDARNRAEAVQFVAKHELI